MNNQCSEALQSILTVSKTCLQAAITEPGFMPWRCGFRVLCAFSVLVLLLRQTGTGKLARWCKRFQGFQEFRDRKFVSANLFEQPFAVYLITSAQNEPMFRIGPTFMLGPQQFLYRRDRILDFASFGNCWILNQSMLSLCSIGKCPIVV